MIKTLLPAGLVLLLVTVGLGCVDEERPVGSGDDVGAAVEISQTVISLTVTGFKEGSTIPIEYTCDGQDFSPAISWGEVPAGTRSIALIMDDPDAPMKTFTHWVIYNMPPDKRDLPGGVEKKERLADGGLQGINDFGKIGYNGPCPPPGEPHRYYFRIYALDKRLDISGGSEATRDKVEKAMKGHVLAKGETMGRYGKNMD